MTVFRGNQTVLPMKLSGRRRIVWQRPTGLRARQKPAMRGASSKQRQNTRRDWAAFRSLCNKGMYGLGLIAVITGFGYAIACAVELPVSRVIVNGQFHQVKKQHITREVQPFLDAGFLRLDLEGIRERLRHLPWVFDASVTRHWPNEIVIAVEEQKVIARWGSKGFLNYRGELFIPEHTNTKWLKAENLPLLNGPADRTKEVMNHFRELSGALSQRGLVLTELTLDERGSWYARLDNGTSMLLGNGEVMDKMRRFLNAYRALLATDFDRVKSVDMRYNNGFAVAWRDSGKQS